jgi:NADH-ubiquinone oxidoreductase chain 1
LSKKSAWLLIIIIKQMAYIFALLEVLSVVVPVLLSVAFMTIIERKVLAAMQRRVGPNAVGVYGTLQPFADALKLVIKETVVPSSSNAALFYLAPSITMVFALLGWAVIPFGTGAAVADLELGVLYSLAVSSVGVYGVLLAGWSANEAYALVGGMRSSAQMVSYELVLGSAVLAVLVMAGTLNMTGIVEAQTPVWYVIPLAPMFILFVISVLAETNRTPFDLPEAESELVAGFMTEHSAMPFVLFFLGEYCSLVLISALSASLFLGGFGFPEMIANGTLLSLSSLILALKTCLGCFGFVWFRATLPRLRFDQLMSFCWTGMLPLAIALVLVVPSVLAAFDVMPFHSPLISGCFIIMITITKRNFNFSNFYNFSKLGLMFRGGLSYVALNLYGMICLCFNFIRPAGP